MTDYVSNTTLDQIAARFRDAQRIIVTTHVKPDGDALGAVLALSAALRIEGKHVEPCVVGPILPNMQSIVDDAAVRVFPADQPIDPPDADCIVVADTGAWSQLEPWHAWLTPRHDKTIVIDHHLQGDDVGATQYIDSRAAAACEIIAELIDVMNCPFDQSIRDALYMGIAADTGWFRFSNTRPQTMELAARLLREGVDHADLYRRLDQGERIEKLGLLIRALDSMHVVNGGNATVMTLRAADFSETGAHPHETERFVDIPQMVGSVQVVALLVEQPDGRTRISLRSKPGPDAVDVNALARRFGGGGHARAAGAKLDQPIDQARTLIIDALSALAEIA